MENEESLPHQNNMNFFILISIADNILILGGACWLTLYLVAWFSLQDIELSIVCFRLLTNELETQKSLFGWMEYSHEPLSGLKIIFGLDGPFKVETKKHIQLYITVSRVSSHIIKNIFSFQVS